MCSLWLCPLAVPLLGPCAKSLLSPMFFCICCSCWEAAVCRNSHPVWRVLSYYIPQCGWLHHILLRIPGRRQTPARYVSTFLTACLQTGQTTFFYYFKCTFQCWALHCKNSEFKYQDSVQVFLSRWLWRCWCLQSCAARCRVLGI